MGALLLVAVLVVVGSLRLIGLETEETRLLRYAICTENVASTGIVPGLASGGPVGVAVRLNQPATEEFARLTAAHLGGDLEVVFSRWVFVRSRLRSSIRSGVIASQTFASQADAEGAVRELESVLPAGPCGLLP